MHFLLNPVGSGGDVHPYVGLGRRLRARGHEVTVLTAEPHRAAVERAELAFVPVFPEEDYHRATLNPDLWHPRRGFTTVVTLVLVGLEPTWRELEARYEPGHTFLVGHPLAFAARAFEEKTGIPAATIHLAPSSIRSAHQVPALPPGVDISGLPLWLKHAFWWAIDRTQLDPAITPTHDRWRASHGLPPVRRVFQSWLNSPRQVITFFPEWFGPRQPDWPERLDYASFPLWDDPAGAPVDAELDAFLAAGSPPVVATPGTANRHATPFFQAVSEALGRLGRRGLFLTGFPEQVPPGLPDTIMTRRYAPLSQVLGRSALLVHHGGIGTLAQGLAAGVPHLIMPMSFDQPDNALRLERLGVARWLPPARFTGDRVASALGRLLEDPAIAAAAAGLRDRTRSRDGLAITADLLERAARV
jgi:rhamnosyltransferase subunit B